MASSAPPAKARRQITATGRPRQVLYDAELTPFARITEASFALGRDPRILGMDETALLERIKELVPAQEARRVLEAYERIHPGMAPSDLLFRVATDRAHVGVLGDVRAPRQSEHEALVVACTRFDDAPDDGVRQGVARRKRSAR